jgi:hypothetical protein
MDNETVKILLAIQSEVSATKTMVEGLAGPEGRIKNLERDQNRQWWVTAAVAPTLALMHATARKFGINV